MFSKSIFFLILVGWMLLILADRILIRGKKKSHGKLWISLMIYLVLTVLSTVFSIDRTLSLKGMLEQYETVWVLWGYILTTYYFFRVVESTEDGKILLTALIIGCVFQAILGMFQGAGLDLWSTVLGKAWLTMWLPEKTAQNLAFGFAESSNKVYLSMYNPNYAGVYLILMLPTVAFGFLWKTGRWQKWLCCLTAIMLLICLGMSGSRTGVFVLALLSVLGFLWIGLKGGKHRWIALGGIILIMAGIAVYDTTSGHRLAKGIQGIFQKKSYAMTEMEPLESAVRICYKGRVLDLSAERTDQGDTLKIMENGDVRIPVYWDMEEQCFYAEDQELSGLQFDAYCEEERQNVVIKWKKAEWYFVREGTQAYQYRNRYGKTDTITNAYTVMPGYERAFTGRGYLWGRTLPLLKNHFLLGSGPDTFVLAFPQNDYVMRANTSRRRLLEIPAKAHNMYLQTAMQTGVCSLICLVSFWAAFLVKSLRVLYRKTRDEKWWMNLGNVLGVFGYLLMGMMNDSVVAVAPLFWGMLGIGMALNERMECKK